MLRIRQLCIDTMRVAEVALAPNGLRRVVRAAQLEFALAYAAAHPRIVAYGF